MKRFTKLTAAFVFSTLLAGLAGAAPVFTENGGVVIFEAEDFSNNVARSSHSWDVSNAIPGYSSSAYMESTPDNGANIQTSVATTSPELQFTADLSATGQRFVWLRGYATNPSNDSVHVGIDGTATTATNITFANSYNAWVWTNKNAAGNSATVSVGSTGLHTISMWMREDGLRLDRVLLTTNASFSATLGNVFHIPSNNTETNAFTMRTPLYPNATNAPVFVFTGNQYQGGGNPGNQLQTGSTLFYRNITNATWSSIQMFFWFQAGNNKYYSNGIPTGAFSYGDTIQYYFKIPYDDHLPTFVYGNDNARFNSELESAAQSDPFSFTVAPPLQPSGPYVAVTNGSLEVRVYQNTGHIVLTGPDLAGNSFSNSITFEPPAFKAGGESMLAGRVLSSSAFGNGVQLVQVAGPTSIVSQITFPYDGVMRYEVVDWGGLPVSETSVTAPSDASEHFYGFGEKFNALDQAGNKVHMLTRDIAGDKNDNSYKVAAWFISNRGYGFHLDDTTESWFDMRNQYADRYVISNFVASSCSSCITNALKFNVVYGPKLTDVLTRYTGYSGRPALPPKWAFAPWMSSDIWHTGGEVRYTISKYRALGIPGSAFVFDSPWEVGYNDFTWNTSQWSSSGTYEGSNYTGFATIGDMMTFIRTNGFYVVCWMTPFVNTSSNNEGIPGQNTGQAANYAEGAASNYFVRASAGGPPLVVPWWKGSGSPIDFTNPNAALWAQNQLSNLVAQSTSGGYNVIAGFKTDDGETDNNSNTYIPTSAVYYDGRTGIEMRNGYCVEYHKTIWNVLGTNGLLFARSGYNGSQAYPGYWAGDNQPNFGDLNGLPSVVVAGLSSAMSGFSIWASDVGGYQNANFSSSLTNLFIRWTQFGAVSPLMQMHRQVDTSNLRQFPWGYGADALTNYIFYAKLHTALFPYIYSYAVESSTNGMPIMRPEVLLNQTDSATYGVKHTFYFGNELLVSPVITNVASTRQVYLPQGKWYDFFTNAAYTGGQNIIWTNANQSQMPLFVREGAIVPMISTNVMTLCDSAYVSNPNLTTMSSALEFMIYPTTNSSFTMYDGTSVQCSSNGTVVTASLTSSPRPILMRLFGPQPFGVERDGVPLPNITNAMQFANAALGWRYDSGSSFLHVKFSHAGGATQIRFGPDSVGDGISDSWRLAYYGSATTTNSTSCASCDFDGDGLANSQEYRAGTLPTDGNSALRVQTLSPSGLNLTVAWPSQIGIRYRVLWKDDLGATVPWQTNGTDFAGDGGIQNWVDNGTETGTPPGSPSVPKRFYKVIVP